MLTACWIYFFCLKSEAIVCITISLKSSYTIYILRYCYGKIHCSYVSHTFDLIVDINIHIYWHVKLNMLFIIVFYYGYQCCKVHLCTFCIRYKLIKNIYLGNVTYCPSNNEYMLVHVYKYSNGFKIYSITISCLIYISAKRRTLHRAMQVHLYFDTCLLVLLKYMI